MKIVRNMPLMLLIFSSLALSFLSEKIRPQDVSDSTKARISKEAIKIGKAPKIILQPEGKAKDVLLEGSSEEIQESNLDEMKSKLEIQKIVRLKVKIKTEKEKEILERIGLKPESGDYTFLKENEAIYIATVEQLSQLKGEGIEFEVEQEGIKIERPRESIMGDLGYGSVEKPLSSAYGENDNNYNIPEGSWVYSPIVINSAAAGAVVSYVNIHYKVIHPYIGDLDIDLRDQDSTTTYHLWSYEGGDGDNIDQTVYFITDFNGEPVNQTWKLWGYDCCPLDNGYIDSWWINIMYEEPTPRPDLIVQSLTPSNPNPIVGTYINVTMKIKNQGVETAPMCWNGLYYNLSSPPDYSTIENSKSSTFSLAPDSSQSLTFTNITSADTGVWHMYGLADCDSEVAEISETNNLKGPVDIHWRAAPKPDLVIQSLTVENYTPVITEHTNGSIVIKNQSSNPVATGFYTDVFKNRSSAPSPPANGEYYWVGGPLMPGAVETHYFYKLPTCLYSEGCSSGTMWKMWGLVDSWDNIQETDESNNAFGPVNIKWSSPPAPHYVTRDQIILNAEDFAFVEWYCSDLNVQFHWACPTWTCAFAADSFYTGEAYSWGGWDKAIDFHNYLFVGLCAGSYSGNNCGAVDAYWATGTDCSGLISRCWELGSRQTTWSLDNFSHQIPVENLRRGDIMLKQGSHVRLFVEWTDYKQDRMDMIEAKPRQACTLSYAKDEILDDGYLPYEYNYISAPPNISGDCNSDGKIDLADVIYLANYCFGGPADPQPLWKADVNGDEECEINLGDVIYLSNYLFKNGPAPFCNGSCWSCV